MLRVCRAEGCTNSWDTANKRWDAEYCSKRCKNRTAQRRKRATQNKEAK